MTSFYWSRQLIPCGKRFEIKKYKEGTGVKKADRVGKNKSERSWGEEIE